MMAFPESGQPLTTLVGVNGSALYWLPQHPIGEERLLIILMNEGLQSSWQVRS